MTAPRNQDSDDLAEFGYSQSLDRSIGNHHVGTLPEHMAKNMEGAPDGQA
jgi:hypothetical protein